MTQLMPDQTREILADPAFRQLTSARARLRWSLSIATLIMFFGFIGLITTAKAALGRPGKPKRSGTRVARNQRNAS